MIMAYPPGIPIIIAGERISQDIIDYIEELKEADLHIQGMEDPELETINVIEEEDAVYLYTEKMKMYLLEYKQILELIRQVQSLDLMI